MPLPIVFGHNDLLPANFLDDGKRLWLIDFEYAGFNTAMFDLAGAASNAGMTAAESDELLAAYFGATPDAGAAARACAPCNAPRCCARRCGAWSRNSISTRPAPTTSPIRRKTSRGSTRRSTPTARTYGKTRRMTLPSHAEIVVIGGGIIGCSTAYHLARDHKADVVLLEQGKLTSGSTWHAAGLVGQLRSSASITRVLKYSVELYKRLEAETGPRDRLEDDRLPAARHQPGPLDRVPPAGDDGAELRHGHAAALAGRGEGDVAADGGRRPRRRLAGCRPTARRAPPTSPSRWPRARACTARSSSRTCASPASR